MPSNAPLGPQAETICRLCRRELPLLQSHILPAFVFRDLKRNSATGHIRFSDRPNVRVQDGIKRPWLCQDCEQRFSAWERKFANEVVVPWSDGRDLTRYSDWLLKFCVSVSWRVLLFAKGLNPEHVYSDEEEAGFVLAERTWREFLLGERPHPGQFDQQLIIWDVAASSTVPDLPTNFNRFMMGSIMMDIAGSKSASYVWSKLGRFQIFGTVRHGPNKWEGTKVHVKDGVLKPGKFGIPASVLELYRQKAKIASEAYEQMSDAQLDKIEANSMADIERFLASRTFRAMQADAELFGNEVIIRKPKRKN